MKKLIKYLITIGIGLIVAFLFSLSREIFGQTNIKVIFQILSDSFFIPAVLIICVGLLVFASNEGVFDGIAYGVMAFMNIFRSKDAKKYSSLYDYRESKKASRKTKVGFLLISGLILLLVAIIMFMMYKKY